MAIKLNTSLQEALHLYLESAVEINEALFIWLHILHVKILAIC